MITALRDVLGESARAVWPGPKGLKMAVLCGGDD